MIEINKVIVPSSTGDGNGKLSYKDGKVVTYEHGSVVNVYLFHEQDGEQQRAFELTVDAPLTYDKCVNAAEMAAYGLADAMAVASFAASLARKQRAGDAAEVAEHDRFMEQVKDELASLGLAPAAMSALEVAIKGKLRELEDYDRSDEVNCFLVNGQTAWIDAATRSNYRGSLSDCELMGVTDIQLPIAGSLLPMTVADAKVYLARVQLYADRCTIVTKMHEAAIRQLQTAEQVAAYDFTAGYPPKEEFNISL